MAVRQIGINSRSITGRHGASGQQFESALERDLLDLLAFDPNVERFETQPVQIHYRGRDGRDRFYTPDVLILYRRDTLPAQGIPHLLCEVKYRDEYRERFQELKDRLRAARRYANEQGWQFRVLTEREIRTPYLDNARFLRPYRDLQPDPDRESRILNFIRLQCETTPTAILEALDADGTDRAKLLPIVWKLIAEFQVGADLMTVLGMRSRIWCLP